MNKATIFQRVAEITTGTYTSSGLLDPVWELGDVVQELILDLLEKHKAGKFSTEDEAWVIAQHKLFDLFRGWGARTERGRQCEEELRAWGVIELQSLVESPERGLATVVVKVTGKEIAEAVKNYRGQLQALQAYGLSPLTDRQKRAGFLLMSGTISPRFLARLTKALIVFGATPPIAQRVVSMGLRRITHAQPVGEDWTVLNNYRKRAGKGVTWESLPGGDIILRRGRFRLFIERI